MNGYTQVNAKKANLLYHRPANRNESNLSMTNKVHDTHLMLLVFLFKEVEDFSLIKFCQMKQLIPISNSLQF